MSTMMCAEDIVVRFDTSNLVPVEFGSALGTSRTQSSQVVELGKKLLHCAREGDTPAVLDLMAKGAPFTTDWLGTSPLHLAAMNDHVETCDVLLRAGISRDSRTKVDRTPLHLAAYEGHQRVCALLLSHGADVDCRDMLLMTPLHWAVEKCHTDVVRILLEFNADPRAVSKFRRTPLSIAADQDSAPLLAALETAVLNNINNKHITDTLRATESIQETNENNDIQSRILQDMKYSDSMEVDEEEDIRESTENEPQDVLEHILPQVQDESPNAATLQLLREHGITMLPADENTTVMSAIKSGRTIVLSDAGKLMLKEVQKPKMMSKPIQIRKNPVIMPSPSPSPSPNIKTAPGKVKIYTLSGNQLMAMTQPKHNTQGTNDTLKKAVANAGINFLQVPKPKPVVSLAQHQRNPIQIKSICPTKLMGGMQSGKKILGGMQSGQNIIHTGKNAAYNLNQLQSLQKDGIIHLKHATGLPGGVKIIMNKNNFGKFVSNPMIKKTLADTANATEGNRMTLTTDNIINISDNNNERLEESLSEKLPDDIDTLKRELMSARQQITLYKKTIMAKDREIHNYKERLQAYEGI